MSRPLGICALCDKESELQSSHIIPAFVFRWLKQAGPIRHTRSINKRVQDGPKVPLLCSSCEARLCEWEGSFANNIFYPYDQDSRLVRSYGHWLMLFCVSVSWRALHYMLQQASPDHLNERQLSSAKKALRTWRAMLRGEEPNPGRFEQHLLPLDAMESFEGFSPPPNMNRYLMRAVDMDLAVGKHTAFTYSKLGKFVIVGFIDVAKPERWVGSRVRVRHGILKPQEYMLPMAVAEYLQHRARKVWEITDQMSPQQQKKVEAEILANPEKYLTSEAFRAMSHDLRLFGSKAFSVTQDEDQR